MPSTFYSFFNILSVFLWNVLPATAAPSSSYLYFYFPNCHENVVRNDDLSSSFRLWYAGLASITVRYFAFVNLWYILFNVWPPWTGLNSAWFSLAGLRHSLTFIFYFVTNTKMVYNSDVFYPSFTIISSCLRHFNCSLNSFHIAFAAHLEGAWYGFLSAFACNENMLQSILFL